jgi:hypothetical protein
LRRLPVAFLESIADFSSIDWGGTWLWDIQFPDAPSPFDRWFPAADIEEPLAHLDTMQIKGGATNFEIPIGSSALIIRINFYDDVNRFLETWITEWIRSIAPGASPVLTLEESARVINISKLDSTRTEIDQYQYLVIPKGTFSFRGNSSAEVPTYPLELVIVG